MKLSISNAIRFLTFTASTLFITGTASAQDPRPLEPGSTVQRDLTAIDSHFYQINLKSGHYVRLVIEQKGIDTVEILTAPDGQKLIEVDGPNGVQGPEPVMLLVDADGAYRLEVRALNRTAVPGRYEVRIEEIRPATSSDRSRVAAQRALLEGQRLVRENSQEAQARALAKFNEAVSLARAAEDRSQEALALHAIGGFYGASGESEKALTFLNQALAIRRAIGDRQGEAQTLSNIGLAYIALGDYQRVLNNLLDALSLQRVVGDRRGEAQALNNICLTYRRLGEYNLALDSCNRSLELHGSIGNRRAEAENLNNIGLIYKSLGDYEKALDWLNRALALKRLLGDRRAEVSTLGNIGEVLLQIGRHQEALKNLNDALALVRPLGDRRVISITLNNIGSVYASTGEHKTALEYFDQALALRKEITDRSGEAVLHYSEARAYRDLGNLNEAKIHIEAALNIVESLRAGVVNRELRDSYFATVQDVYEFYVELLMKLDQQQPDKDFSAAALAASERGRARGLLELLAESQTDIRQGVDPVLLERERSLQKLINVKAENLVRLLSGGRDVARAGVAAKDLDALSAEYEHVRAQIRSISPRYAALTQPVPLGLKEIQDRVLDANTLMLEYALGKDRSFLWAVTSDSLSAFELPSRQVIEEAARRVYEAMKVSHTRQRQRQAELVAGELSRMLLGAVTDRLNKPRLLIIADGALQYVPFAALPLPDEKNRIYKPLVTAHEVVTSPSASVLYALRGDLTKRKAAAKMLAVLADPVLQADDVRVTRKGVKSTGKQLPETLLRSVREAGVVNFERLPFTRREAETILALSRNRSNLRALDFDASRATATSPDLANYRMVHFATHGLINSEHPELSGVVLSLVDESGQPQDGFLRLHDIYNLKLGTDLVVLSACQTALGKQIKGEGLIGLVRGFMYAGAPRVIASLWDVRDEATAELMKRFYSKMLLEKQSPAAAFRSAQISLWREPRWRAPYYWAGFSFQGEWR